jgi:transcriptional regulator with XRE-family HTH domain
MYYDSSVVIEYVKEDNVKFYDKLTELRKKNNITQEQLADYLGVSRQSVSRWESGLAYPETEKIIKISELFSVTIDYLLKDNLTSGIYKAKKIAFASFRLSTTIIDILIIYSFIFSISLTYIVGNRIVGFMILSLGVISCSIAYAIIRSKFIENVDYNDSDKKLTFNKTRLHYTFEIVTIAGFLPLLIFSTELIPIINFITFLELSVIYMVIGFLFSNIISIFHRYIIDKKGLVKPPVEKRYEVSLLFTAILSIIAGSTFIYYPTTLTTQMFCELVIVLFSFFGIVDAMSFDKSTLNRVIVFVSFVLGIVSVVFFTESILISLICTSVGIVSSTILTIIKKKRYLVLQSNLFIILFGVGLITKLISDVSKQNLIVGILWIVFALSIRGVMIRHNIVEVNCENKVLKNIL